MEGITRHCEFREWNLRVTGKVTFHPFAIWSFSDIKARSEQRNMDQKGYHVSFFFFLSALAFSNNFVAQAGWPLLVTTAKVSLNKIVDVLFTRLIFVFKWIE